MGKLIINTMDGTVCEFTGTVIVDTDTFDDAGKALFQEWQDGGNDGTASELGEKYGTPLERFTDNDLTYANSMSFSPKALRDEFDNSSMTGIPEFKFAEQLTDEQLQELGQYILSSDYLWNVYQEELLSGIRNYARDIMGREVK